MSKGTQVLLASQALYNQSRILQGDSLNMPFELNVLKILEHYTTTVCFSALLKYWNVKVNGTDLSTFFYFFFG